MKPFATLFLRVIWPLGVNFTNIFWAAFAPKSFCQKITNPNFKHIKAAQKLLHEKAAHKILVKLTAAGGVNFTNILWAAFAPKSFCQKITNPNCKHLKAAQRTLAWLSISPTFYKQLFHNKVLCSPFMCLQFGFVIFWQKDFGAKSAHKMLVKLTPDWAKSYHLGYIRWLYTTNFHPTK